MGKKNAINNFIIWLAVFVLFIIFLEFSLRLWSKFSGKVAFSKITIDDQLLDWRLSANYSQSNRGIHINSKGFRGKEFELEKNINSLRVLSLGDSCTFGAGSSTDEFTYPGLLENKIKHSGLGWMNPRVINAGVPGYTLRQCLLYYKNELWKLGSDVIIIYGGWNDIWTYRNPYSNTAASSELRSISRFLGRSLLFSLCRDYIINPVRVRLSSSVNSVVLEGKSINVDEALKATMLKAYRNNLDSLISITLGNGHKVVLVTLASPLRAGMDEKLKATFSLHPMWKEGHGGLFYLQQEVNKIIRGLASQRGVSLVDVDMILGSLEVGQVAGLFSDAVHFNDKGNELLADYLYLEITGLMKGSRIL